MFQPASRHVKYFHPVFSAVNGHVRVHSFSPGSESTVLVPGYSEYKQTIDCTVACSIDQIWNCGLRCGILLIRLWANVLSPIKLACFKNLYMHVCDRKEDPTSKEIVWIVVASSLKFLFLNPQSPWTFSLVPNMTVKVQRTESLFILSITWNGYTENGGVEWFKITTKNHCQRLLRIICPQL